MRAVPRRKRAFGCSGKSSRTWVQCASAAAKCPRPRSHAAMLQSTASRVSLASDGWLVSEVEAEGGGSAGSALEYHSRASVNFWFLKRSLPLALKKVATSSDVRSVSAARFVSAGIRSNSTGAISAVATTIGTPVKPPAAIMSTPRPEENTHVQKVVPTTHDVNGSKRPRPSPDGAARRQVISCPAWSHDASSAPSARHDTEFTNPPWPLSSAVCSQRGSVGFVSGVASASSVSHRSQSSTDL
mmetsp:Transcript_30040/g.71502  ORF Transcript_30040/g.71502 Transcript_30040/m.71502 type:complete len:243 (-) Transcript_30040:767-1495(-)